MPEIGESSPAVEDPCVLLTVEHSCRPDREGSIHLLIDPSNVQGVRDGRLDAIA